MTIVAMGPNTITITGTVVGFIVNGFSVQGGKGLGYYHVATTAATKFVGPQPYVGERIEASGTGTEATSMTADSVAQYLTLHGPVVALRTGGFQIQGGRGVGYLHIWVTPSTQVSGPAPFVGENVIVAGPGSAATSLTAFTVQEDAAGAPATAPSPSSSPSPSDSAAPLASPSPIFVPTPGTVSPPDTSSFMPSSWGKISAFQVFDDTGYGYVTQGAAAADGYRYSAIWGARNNIGTAWLASNPSLQTGYYNALATDESPTGWGSVGHTLTWWKANHPDWVLYNCSSTGAATQTPAWISGLPNVPLDIHNPAVVDYQIRLMANYAHALGYRALAIDEATFWQAAKSVAGSYGCGIYQNGTFVRRYSGIEDANYASDVVAWVKRAHALLTSDPAIAPYHIKLMVNHPENSISSNEQQFLANVDADLNEDGFTWFGNSKKSSPAHVARVIDWSIYAQKHGVAVLTDDNWGAQNVGPAQIDYSIATYLLANEQAESIYVAPESGFGLEQWHAEYGTQVGAPCGEYYSAGDGANPGIYYRRFANAIVVVNAGSSARETAHLPAAHTYRDLMGRPVSDTLGIDSNDGYVLLTSNGCN